MDVSLPQAYLVGLLLLLGTASVLVARQILRVRRDESALARLEAQAKGSEKSAGDLYELASVQLRKRLYGQATENLKLAAKRANGEPSEAQALIENALGFARLSAGAFGGQLQIFSGLAIEALPQLDGGQFVEIAGTLLASLRLGLESCEGGFVAADPQDLAGNQDRGGA